MKSSPNKRPTRHQRKGDAAAILNQRIQARYPNQKVIIGEIIDGVKMSEVLKKFVEPYRDIANTEGAFRNLMATAMIAWNATLFSVEKRTEYLENIFESFPEGVREDARFIISDLIARKERYFSEYKRMILDYEVTDTGKDFQLMVISSMDEYKEE